MVCRTCAKHCHIGHKISSVAKRIMKEHCRCFHKNPVNYSGASLLGYSEAVQALESEHETKGALISASLGQTNEQDALPLLNETTQSRSSKTKKFIIFKRNSCYKLLSLIHI